MASETIANWRNGAAPNAAERVEESLMEFTTMVETRSGDVSMTFHVPEFREADEIAANMDCSFKTFDEAHEYVRRQLPHFSNQMIDDIAWALTEPP